MHRLTRLLIKGGHAVLNSTILCRRLLKVLPVAVILISLLPAMSIRPVSAGALCASGDCVLACNPRLRQCSMYSLREVTDRLVVVKYMPYGYKRVYSNSLCERRVCSRNNSSCYSLP